MPDRITPGKPGYTPPRRTPPPESSIIKIMPVLEKTKNPLVIVPMMTMATLDDLFLH